MTESESAAHADAVAPRHRGRRDDGGFVLIWFSMLLLILIAMAGFGVDMWNWWYTSQQVQRAADAGALAGVTFVPADFSGGKSTANAAVRQNGYVAGKGTKVVVCALGQAGCPTGLKSNQLQVSVQQKVNNYFTSLLGLATTTIKRTAVAEFNAPIAMGSPASHLGNDPENGGTDKHWLNIGAPGVDKHTGDRYADLTNCTSSYKCSGTTNSEYFNGTYVFAVDMPSPGDIQVYDPELAVGNTSCDNQWLTSTQITSLKTKYPTQYADAATRYATGANDYCTGDDNTNIDTTNGPQATAWIVRDSVKSVTDPISNDIVGAGGPTGGACVHQFKGYNPNSATYWYDRLNGDMATSINPTNPTYDQDFAKSFHRYYTICKVPAAGRYFVQVRSNIPYDTTQPSLAKDATYLSRYPNGGTQPTNLAGQNRYSLRATVGGTNLPLTGAQTYAESHLPVYTNTVGSNTPNFYLARVLPGGGQAGRVLHLSFYDIGDLASGTSTTLTITPPSESPASSVTCSSWVANGNQAMPTSTVSGCAVSGITSNNYPTGFNGVLVTVNISLAGNYTCTVSDPTKCWFKIKMNYTSTGQSNDTTTWDANIGGDPVRLVQ